LHGKKAAIARSAIMKPALFLALVAFQPACTTESNAPTQPIAEVSLANGNVVSFYESAPGAISIAQEFSKDTAPVADQGRSAVEVYRSLAPGQPVPGALADAQARADEARANRPVAVVPPRESWIDNTTIDDKWFANTYCSGSWQQLDCALNKTTNNYYYGFSDVDEVYIAGCADRGTERLSVSIDDDDQRNWTLLEGRCVLWHWTSGWTNSTIIGYVLDVGGNDRYHFSFRSND
jgi:hypothetical protein